MDKSHAHPVVLGLTVATHDTSAALMLDGVLQVAVEEERLSRNKHTSEFPHNAIQACLGSEGMSIDDVDVVAISWDVRQIYQERYIKRIFSDEFQQLVHERRDELQRLLEIESCLESYGYNGRIEYHSHHLCHTIYSYATSPFKRCAYMTLDGYGEVESGRIGLIDDGVVETFMRFDIDNSLGLLYSAVTWFLGFTPHCDEGIVMGLASYGDPSALVDGGEVSYYDIFSEIIRDDDESVYRIDRDYVLFGLRKVGWVSEKFRTIFGEPRGMDDVLAEHHMHIAAALQKRIEEVVQAMASRLYTQYEVKELCLSGGLALNCVANGQLHFNSGFEHIHIPSAPGDNGLSIGAALLSGLPTLGQQRITASAYLGPKYSQQQIDDALSLLQGSGCTVMDGINSIQVAQKLADGDIVAVCQGRSEFGPRALGNRSILARPFPQEMKEHLNRRVKFREDFRPFAPAVLEEMAGRYFDIQGESYNMTKTFPSVERARLDIPAALHVDGSGRVQTVNQEQNKGFHELIQSFYELTGIPVLLNTSFNVKGQPIVETPRDAVETFLSTDIDTLYLAGNYLISKVKEG